MNTRAGAQVWRGSKQLPPRLAWVNQATWTYRVHGRDQQVRRGIGHYEVLACIDRPDETYWTTHHGNRGVSARRGDVEVVYDPATREIITVSDINSSLRTERGIGPRTPMVPTQAQEVSYLLAPMSYVVVEGLDPVTAEALRLVSQASRNDTSVIPMLVELPQQQAPEGTPADQRGEEMVVAKIKDGKRELPPRQRNTPVRVPGLQATWDDFLSRRKPGQVFSTHDWVSFALVKHSDVPRGTITGMQYRAEQIGEICNVSRSQWRKAHPVVTSNNGHPMPAFDGRKAYGVISGLWHDFLDQFQPGDTFSAQVWRDYLTASGALPEVTEPNVYGKLAFQVGATIERIERGHYKVLPRRTNQGEEEDVSEADQDAAEQAADELMDSLLAADGDGLQFVDFLPGQEPQVTDFTHAMELVLDLPELTGALAALAKDPARRFALVASVAVKGHRNVAVQIVRHPTEPDVYHLYARATDMEAGA